MGLIDNIEIKLQASPTYRITTECKSLIDGENDIKKSIELISSEIKKYGGICFIKQDCKIITC